MNQMHIGQRIKRRREQQGLSLQDVADQLDVNRSSVMRWENGETNRIKLPIVEKLAQILQTSPGYLMGYEEFAAGDSGGSYLVENACFLPVLKTIQPPEELFRPDNIMNYEAAESCYRYAHCFYLFVAGDSMAPRLEAGDRVLVKQQTSLQNGQLGVFILDGKDCLIREFFQKDGWELRSFNPYYPALHIQQEEVSRVQIIGAVMESRRAW